MKKIEYVLSFLFTPDYKNVWLIEKQKPDWQKGFYNGIGGKIEKNETAKDSIIRELNEESGVDIQPSEIFELGYMNGVNNDGSDFIVYIFTGVTDKKLETVEEEKIELIKLDELDNYKCIENVYSLIELSKYYLLGNSNFNKLVMEYGFSHNESEWLMTQLEQTTDRYIDAERKLTELSKLTFFERIFMPKKVRKYFKKTLSKYNF